MSASLAGPLAGTSNCCLVPFLGLFGPAGSFKLRKNQRCNSKGAKRGGGVITAKVELKPLPYSTDSLEPAMSRETLEYHWGKHHRGYVDNLNKQIVGTELDEKSLEEIILLTYNKGDFLPPFNNAAQAWNHEFFWESMKPGGGGEPSGEVLELIIRDFGSFHEFVNEFKTAAATQIGSGWAWLVYKANRLNVGNAVNPRPKEEDKKLVVVKSPNAINPLVWDYSPLLAVDVWEHAYYIDFQSRRPDYISTFIEKLVSWETVAARLEAAKAKAMEREAEQSEKTEYESDEQTSSESMQLFYDSSESETE